MAAFRRKVADSTGRLLSCLVKSKRSNAWNTGEVDPVKPWADDAPSILSQEDEPKFDDGAFCFTDASPVASIVILFGGEGVGLVVGVSVPGNDGAQDGSLDGESVGKMQSM